MTAANVNIIDRCFGNESEIALDLASERDDYTSPVDGDGPGHGTTLATSARLPLLLRARRK